MKFPEPSFTATSPVSPIGGMPIPTDHAIVALPPSPPPPPSIPGNIFVPIPQGSASSTLSSSSSSSSCSSAYFLCGCPACKAIYDFMTTNGMDDCFLVNPHHNRAPFTPLMSVLRQPGVDIPPSMRRREGGNTFGFGPPAPANFNFGRPNPSGTGGPGHGQNGNTQGGVGGSRYPAIENHFHGSATAVNLNLHTPGNYHVDLRAHFSERSGGSSDVPMPFHSFHSGSGSFQQGHGHHRPAGPSTGTANTTGAENANGYNPNQNQQGQGPQMVNGSSHRTNLGNWTL